MITLQLDITNADHRRGLFAFMRAMDGTPEAETVAPPERTKTADQFAEQVDQHEAAIAANVAEQRAEIREGLEQANAAVPTTTTTTTADLTALDKNGVPYDSRIHTGTRSTNKDGSWRYKPGVDRAEAERIEAQLKALVGDTMTAAAEYAPVEPPSPQFGQAQSTGAAVPPPSNTPTAEQVGIINRIDCLETAVVPPPPPQNIDFAALMRRIGSDSVGDKAIAEALAIAGVPSLPALGIQQDKVGAVYKALFPNG